jgi:4,4'-diaponeurosporenoate glycosyltransferase
VISVALVLGFWLLGWVLFWRVPTVEPASGGPGRSVSVIVPARNEEANLERLLASLLRQTPAPHEVIVVDDHSTDATQAVARAAGASVLASAPLPDGWAGKPWACWQGAERAGGELLLFLDADTWLRDGGLAGLVATHERLPGPISVQPYHAMVAPAERLGALFNLVTMMGVGAFTVLGDRVPARAAFGPCLLVARDDYFAAGGHRVAAGTVLEGLPLGQALAEAGRPVRCLAGRGAVYFRMYPDGVGAMVDGFAKGFATGAGAVRPWVLAAVVAWVGGGLSTTRHLAMALALPDTAVAPWAVLAGMYALQMRAMLARIGNFGWWPAFLFPVPIVFFVGVFSLSVYRIAFRRRVRWKGREVATR